MILVKYVDEILKFCIRNLLESRIYASISRELVLSTQDCA